MRGRNEREEWESEDVLVYPTHHGDWGPKREARNSILGFQEYGQDPTAGAILPASHGTQKQESGMSWSQNVAPGAPVWDAGFRADFPTPLCKACCSISLTDSFSARLCFCFSFSVLWIILSLLTALFSLSLTLFFFPKVEAEVIDLKTFSFYNKGRHLMLQNFTWVQRLRCFTDIATSFSHCHSVKSIFEWKSSCLRWYVNLLNSSGHSEVYIQNFVWFTLNFYNKKQRLKNESYLHLWFFDLLLINPQLLYKFGFF